MCVHPRDTPGHLSRHGGIEMARTSRATTGKVPPVSTYLRFAVSICSFQATFLLRDPSLEPRDRNDDGGVG